MSVYLNAYPAALRFDPNLFINTQTAHYREFEENYTMHQFGDWAASINSISSLQWEMASEFDIAKESVRRDLEKNRHRVEMFVDTMRRKIRQQLDFDPRPRTRLPLDQYSYVACKRAYKMLGEMARKAGSLDMIPSMNLWQWLDDYSFAPVTDAIQGAIDENSSIYTCECCNERRHSREHGQHETNNGTVVCTDCADCNYTYSECMDTYIHNDSSHAVFNTCEAWENDERTDVCTRYYGRDHFYGHEGLFFTNSEECELAEEHEASARSRSYIERNPGALSGYHETARHWVETNSTPAIPSLGVELEVYAQGVRSDIVAALRSEYGTNLMLERDGSLNDDKGFEIITHPMGQTEWARFGPKLLTTLRKANVVGFDTPDSNSYGIHVNVHRKHLSPLAEARIMMFLCAEENEDFVTAVAQRRSIYAASMEIGQLVKRTQTIRHIGGMQFHHWNNKATKKIQGVGKYAPVCWKDDIAEFRLFNSTLNETSFMKDLEFVWALIAWTREATGRSWMHQDFLTWLSHPACRTTYPALVKYLSRSRFRIRSSDDVESTWQRQMFRPVEGFADYTETYVAPAAPAAQLVA